MTEPRLPASRPDYPDAARLDLSEELHGHRVSDPYRWLEDAASEQTEAWAAAQDALLAESDRGRAGSRPAARPGRDAARGRRRERALVAG